MGIFKLKNKIRMDDITPETIIQESDFSTVTPSGMFIQLEYQEDSGFTSTYEVKPGIWAINKEGPLLVLQKTEFVRDRILESFIHTKEISDKIDFFFNRLDVYYEHGFEVPKRGCLLYGPAGSGKTTAISKVVDKYGSDGTTAIIVWHTDKFEAGLVKDFIKSFKYVGVKKMILIAEDVGGTEIDQVRRRSDSSLLSLLDNQEKTFSIPIYIIATTNFPETFMGNLTNRPNRFDDKIEVGFPPAAARQELLVFFSKKKVKEDAIKLITSNKAAEFTPAHIREVIIRAAIYDKELADTITEMFKEIEHYKAAFQKRQALGMGV